LVLAGRAADPELCCDRMAKLKGKEGISLFSPSPLLVTTQTRSVIGHWTR